MAQFRLQDYDPVLVETGVPVLYYDKPETDRSCGWLDLEQHPLPIIISLKVRSVGQELSCVYPFIICYADDGFGIPAHLGGLVKSGFAAIIQVRDCLEIEAEAEVLQALQRHQIDPNVALAFFFDGMDNHLPDYIITTTERGNMSRGFSHQVDFIYTMTGQGIILNPALEIPDSVIEVLSNGRCKVRLHGKGTYVHPIEPFFAPKDSWQECSIEMSPVGGYSEDDRRVRMGTRMVKVGFLANYNQQDQNVGLLVKDFKVPYLC